MPQSLRQPACQVCGSGPSSNLLLAQPRLPCRGRAASRHVSLHAFRGAKLLAPLLSSEQPSQQSPEQQQQQPQQLQGSDAPIGKSLGLFSWAGSGDKQSATESNQEQQQEEQPVRQDTASPSAYTSLLFVSLLWGSYTPVLRYLYSMDDLLTPQVLTAHRTVISASALITASVGMFAVDKFQRYQQHQRLQQQLREEQLQREMEEQARKQWLRMLPALLLNMLAPFGSSSTTTSSRGHSSKQQPLFPLLFRPPSRSSSSSSGGSSSGGSSSSVLWPLLQWLPGASKEDGSAASSSSTSSSSSSSGSSSQAAPLSAVLLAGLELGTWNFLATAAQACGLNLSTATKAAFLTQTTAVFTPCLAMLCGQAVLPAHWVACLAALMGSFCITLDSMGVQDINGESSPAAVISSTERQQQEAVSTLQQTAATGLVGDVLEAPAVLAAATGPAAPAAAVQDESSSIGLQQSEVQPMLQSAAVPPALTPDVGVADGAASDVQSGAAGMLAASEETAAGVLQQAQQEGLPSAVAPDAAGSTEQQVLLLQEQQLLAGAASSEQESPSSGLQEQQVLGSVDSLSGCADDSLECSAVRLQQYQQQLTQWAVEEQEDPTAAAFADAFGLPRDGLEGGSLADGMQDLEQPALSGVISSPADVQQQPDQLDWQQQMEQELQLVQSLVTESTAPSTSPANSSWGISGEVYILLACCCYAIATVRLSMLAPGLDPVQLATSKTLTLAAASLVWLLAFESGADIVADAAGSVDVAAGAAGRAAMTTAEAAAAAGGMLEQAGAAVQSAWASWQLPPAFDHGQGKLLLFYSALGPGALATVLQTKGQGTVAAAQAQVFYSLTPVWAALLAITCLQGEEMGPLAWLGGGIIIAASIGAAISGSRGSSSSEGDSEP